MLINKVVEKAFELMRAEMLDTILSVPEEFRPNLESDILYGVIKNRTLVAKIANKLEVETKLKPQEYGVKDVKTINWG